MSNRLMDALLRRKYIDIIYHESSQWANLDAPTPNVKLGDYGDVDKNTGKFTVSGNICDPDFQVELDREALRLYPADHPPQEKDLEDDLVVSSKGAKRVDLGPEADPAAIDKGQWQFKEGKRDALLIMHRPRLHSLPEQVPLRTLNKAPKLKDKYLVTSVYLCPAFSMYLSNKTGETVSFALVAQVPGTGTTAGANGGLGWRSNASTDTLVCKPYNETGNNLYAPLYALKRCREGIWQRLFRAEEDPEDQLKDDDLWDDAPPPWDPLDDDGDIDSLSLTEEPDDPDVF